MQNIWWDLSKRSLPALSSAIVFVVGNALVYALEGKPYAASLWLWTLLILVPAISFAYRVSLFPGPVRWTLTEAVAFVAFETPVRKTEWEIFNRVSYARGEIHVSKEITTEGEKVSAQIKTIFKGSEQAIFEKKTQEAFDKIMGLARRGEVTITGRIVGQPHVSEIAANYFVEHIFADFQLNELGFKPHSGTEELPTFQQVLFFRDEILAIKGFWKPLLRPKELSSDELDELWAEKLEMKRSIKITPGAGAATAGGRPAKVIVGKGETDGAQSDTE